MPNRRSRSGSCTAPICTRSCALHCRTGVLIAGAEVSAVSPDGHVELSDSRSERADLVVAADGLNSTARAQLFADHPGVRYAGYTAWRGVTAGPFPLDAAAETWGRGAEFGATILTTGNVYWFAPCRRSFGAASRCWAMPPTQ